MISVSRPLDYEQIPNGLIYLTVMAKDAGSPPLNSTVPVTIEVFVSTQGLWPRSSGYRVADAFWRAGDWAQAQRCGAMSLAVPTAQAVLSSVPSKPLPQLSSPPAGPGEPGSWGAGRGNRPALTPSGGLRIASGRGLGPGKDTR